MEVERVYADRAASARINDGPQFQRMVSDARDGGWASSSSRSSTGLPATGSTQRASVRLRDAGVELVSAMDDTRRA